MQYELIPPLKKNITNPPKSNKNTLIAFVEFLLVQEMFKANDEFMQTGVNVQVLVDHIRRETSNVFSQNEPRELITHTLQRYVYLNENWFVWLGFDIEVSVFVMGINIIDGRVGVGEFIEGDSRVQFLLKFKFLGSEIRI